MKWPISLLLVSIILAGCSTSTSSEVVPTSPDILLTEESFSITIVSPVSPITSSTPTPRVLVVTPDSTDNPDEEVIIAEIFNSDQEEYVVIKNNSSTEQIIGGWYLINPRTDLKFQFPKNFTLSVGSAVRVHSGKQGIDKPPTDFYWSEKDIWTDNGDAVLLNSAGRVIFWHVY